MYYILQQQILQSENSKKSFGNAEKKLLILFLFNMLIGMLGLIDYALLVTIRNDVKKPVFNYFTCESATPGNCEMYRDDALQQQQKYQGLTYTVYILIALFPLVNLVYIFSYNELKKIILTQKILSTATHI